MIVESKTETFIDLEEGKIRVCTSVDDEGEAVDLVTLFEEVIDMYCVPGETKIHPNHIEELQEDFFALQRQMNEIQRRYLEALPDRVSREHQRLGWRNTTLDEHES